MSTGDEIVELEAMRDDCSWLPCRVSLSYDGGGLLVEFEGNKSEKMHLTRDEVVHKLRVRSVPLKDYDCSLVKNSEPVLATLASNSESLFFDALVVEIMMGRHSRSMMCKCNFKIKWLHLNHIKEIFTVPSTSVRRLSTKSIHVHQTVRACLESERKLAHIFVPLIQNHDSDSNYDLDLNKLVEHQIERVGTSSSNPEDMMVSAAEAKRVVISDYNLFRGPNNLRRSTQSLSKLNVSSCVSDDDFINIHCLSPLAACAALALHLSETPLKFEFSVQSEEQQDMVPGDATKNRDLKRKSGQQNVELSITPRYNTRSRSQRNC